jgi:hypothetical protein
MFLGHFSTFRFLNHVDMRSSLGVMIYFLQTFFLGMWFILRVLVYLLSSVSKETNTSIFWLGKQTLLQNRCQKWIHISIPQTLCCCL